MNILFFSPEYIYYPIDAGSRIRIYNMGKLFQALGHQVHFVYYADNGIDLKSLNFMQESWDTFTVIEKKISNLRKTGNYNIDERYENDIATIVNELVEKFYIDVVWVNYIFQSKLLESLPRKIFKVIDTHDIFTDRYKLFEGKEEINYTWYSFSKDDEAKALNRADLIVAITEEEAAYFSSISHTNVKVIGHVESQQFIENNCMTLKKVGFLGGGNSVNIAAINDFLTIFFENNIKDIQIVIAGEVCKYINIEHKELILLGRVDNLHDFYNEIDLVINPLTFGTGQKIKSVEALAYGVPIISTSVGFEGINSLEKNHNLKSIREMVDVIKLIAKKPEVIDDMAENSRQIFRDYQNDNEMKIKDLFPSEIMNFRNLIPDNIVEYRQLMAKKFVEIVFDTQKRLIEEKDTHIIKQSDWIRKQEGLINDLKKLKSVVNELSNVSVLVNPVKKIKLYKKLMETYRRINKE